jgi:predicted metal-dependent peptidase
MFQLSALTEEQRIQKSAITIMAHPKWATTGGVLMVGERRICDETPTAYTNGKDVVFGRAFVSKLSDAELRFLDLHEQMHKAKRHLITWQHLQRINAHCANVAMDHNINLEITEHDGGEGFVIMPEGGCYDPKYKGWDTAKIFWDIYNPNDPDNEKGNGGKDTGFDEHDWEGAQEMTAEEIAELERDIDEAVRQGHLLGGKLGSGGDRLFGELLEPQVNWVEVMRDFVTSTCAGSDIPTFKKPNRRYMAAGYYMPSSYAERVGPIVNANDMSGSIGNREISIIQSEMAAIASTLRPTELHVMYWDTEVVGHEVYAPHEYDDITKRTKPVGGGGTMVECVPKFINENKIEPQCAIVVTDGYLGGDWGEWSCPVLWVVINNKRAVPSVGKVVHVTTEQLNDR